MVDLGASWVGALKIPQDHPLASGGEYPLTQFESNSFIEASPGEGADNARVFARYGIVPNVRCSVSDYHAGMRLVEAWRGLRFVLLARCARISIHQP